jgi:hypothetical protein
MWSKEVVNDSGSYQHHEEDKPGQLRMQKVHAEKRCREEQRECDVLRRRSATLQSEWTNTNSNNTYYGHLGKCLNIYSL